MWNKQVKIFQPNEFSSKISIQIGEDHIDKTRKNSKKNNFY